MIIGLANYTTRKWRLLIILISRNVEGKINLCSDIKSYLFCPDFPDEKNNKNVVD